MKILIVGNDPHDIGGVVNYTRPLAQKFAEMGHDVTYLYSGAWNRKYNWLLFPYIRKFSSKLGFDCAEIVNSANLPFNFGNSHLDIASPQMEKIIGRFLLRVKPDVMHIHSRLGLPSTINEIAHKLNIKVINTFHVYGYLCQKRVMIDHDGAPCEGPSSIEKCGYCTGTFDHKKEINKARIWATKRYIRQKSQFIFDTLKSAKVKSSLITKSIENPSGQKISAPIPTIEQIEGIKRRLEYNIKVLNDFSDMNICVSEDVRNTFKIYGLKNEKMLVQHIGSLIAERSVLSRKHELNPKKIVIGNIGGVNHYKGTHVLLEAFTKIHSLNYELRIYGWYDTDYVKNILPEMKINVSFLGKYTPQDLPKLLKDVDIMVLPSICNDTAPQTIFESFSENIPVIASNIGGFPDFVKNDVNGLLFRAGDSSDLSSKIDMVLEDPTRIERYRKNVPKLKTITENAAELLELYK